MEHTTEIVIALVSSITTTTLIGGMVFVMRSWLIERLSASIKHEYDLKLLEIERQREIRLKAEIVSELLAQWIRKNGTLDYCELNRLSFQAFIWLPKGLAEELSNSLTKTPGAQDVRSIIKNVREYLQGENDGLKARDIVVFDEPDVSSSHSFSQVNSDAIAKPKPHR